MAVYKTVFDFSVGGNAETSLRAIKAALDQINNSANTAGFSKVGNDLKESAAKGEGAVSQLSEKLKSMPKDESVKLNVKTGDSKGEISQLSEKVKSLPKDKSIRFSANTGTSKAAVSELTDDVKKLPKDKQINIKTDTESGTSSVHKLNDQLDNTSEKGGKAHSVLAGAFGGTVIAGAVQSIGSKLTEVTKSSVEVAEAGEEIRRVWESMGTGDKGATALITQMADLRAKTGYSAAELTKIQKGFYGLTDDVGATQKLTTAMAGIGVASGLSGDKVAGMTRTIGRLSASTSVTTTMLSRVENQAPALGNALAKAAGMGRSEFDKLVSSGKLTGTQFQDLMEKVSTQSPDAFKKFGETGQGALAQIKGAWLSDKNAFGAKLLTVQSTGLADLKDFLGSTAMKGLMTDAATGLSKIAGLAATGLSAIAKNVDVFKDAFTTAGSIIGDTLGVADGALKMFGMAFVSNVDSPIKKSPVIGILGEIRKGFSELSKDIAPVTQAIGGFAGVFAASAFNNVKSLFDGLTGDFGSIGIKGKDLAGTFNDIAKKIYPVTNQLNDLGVKMEPVSKAIGAMLGDIAKDTWKDFTGTMQILGKALQTSGEFVGGVAKAVASMLGIKTSGGLQSLGDIIKHIAENKLAIEAVSAAITAMLVAKMASSGLSLAVGGLDKMVVAYGKLSGFKGLLGKLFSVSGETGFASSFSKLKQLPGLLKSLSPKPIKDIFSGLTSGFGGMKSGTIGFKAQISNMKQLPALGKVAGAAVGVGIAAGAAVDIYKGIKSKNPDTKFKSFGSAAGTVIGGGIGFAIAGPAGAAIGATIGKVAGKWAGESAKKFTDGWNKAGKGAKPPSGLLPKAGYYAREAGDGVVSFSKNIISGMKKHKTEILASFVSPVAGVAAWFLKDTKTGAAVTKWAKKFSSNVKKMGFAKAVQGEISSASKAFSKTKFGTWFNGISKSYNSWQKGFSKSWSSGWNKVGSAVKSGLNTSSRNMSSFGSNAGKWLGGFTKSFRNTWSKHWKSLSGDTKSALNDVEQKTNSWGSDTGKWWNGFSKSFRSSWDNHWNNTRKDFGSAMDTMSQKKDSWGNNFNKWWSGFSSSFSSGWHSFWNGIGKFFNDVFSKLGDYAKSGMNGVIGFINGGIKGVNKVVSFFGGKSKIGEISKLANGTGGHKGGPALINDGAGSDYKELVVTPDNHMMMAQERNVLVPDLPTGSQVLSGSDTKNYMSSIGINHYASGTSGALNWVTGKLDDIGSWVKDKSSSVDKLLKDPMGALESVWNKATSGLKLGSDFATSFAPPAGKWLIKQGEGWFKKMLSSAKDALGDAGGGKGAPGGSGVTRWTGQLKEALKANELPTSAAYVNAWLRQIATESSGNQRAIQGDIGDVNNASGDLAKGLLQTISTTFNASKFPGHGNIFNGYDNMLAAINYAKKAYGSSMLSVIGHGHGYAEGGIISQPEYALIGEAGKEFVINPDKPNALQLAMSALKDIIAKRPSLVSQVAKPSYSYSGATVPVSSVAASTVNGGQSSLIDRIDQLVDNTQKLVAKDSNVYMDREKVTKQVNQQGMQDYNIMNAQLG
ncbi:tape measure protein [Loigolactobacillus backii]|uniref:tape measure protein n=1 Tax=Loigolactobacillus backii TaxID=375175 RepID=UPI0007F05DC9|nr:tape measure protein [Loigolactobacillus backii]ANK59810.1 hypothetical protein AYR52_05775 [Loigolactobacillus backii]